MPPFLFGGAHNSGFDRRAIFLSATTALLMAASAKQLRKLLLLLQ
jgi:hypothetical protein